MEDDNSGFLDELGLVTSKYGGGRLEVQVELGFTPKAEDEEILHGLRGLKRGVIFFVICVMLLLVVIFMKWVNGVIIPSRLSSVVPNLTINAYMSEQPY